MSLKVFDLQCGQGHVFEGWFSPDNSFEKQAARGLLECPVCGDDAIERKLSAPRLNLGRKEQPGPGGPDINPALTSGQAAQAGTVLPQLAELQGRIMQKMRALVQESEDVGPRFAQEALMIHQGQAEDRLIRGTATPDEHRELLDEGIQVLAVPDFLNDDQLQ